jgi:serine/threonine protein kinase
MLNKIQSSKTGKIYKTIKPLGKGQYGNVYLIEDEQKNQYALKQVDLNILKEDKNMLKLFENEIKIMEMMNNPRILKLYDMVKVNNMTGLITMFCDGGNLEDMILSNSKKGQKGVGEKEATFYLRQIAEGFNAMQSNKIIHRDLKLANIFLHQGNVVIGDFGFAKIGVSITKTKLGTPYYMAPEILNSQNKNSYSNKVDVWSIGVCYYFLIFGFMPFQDATDKVNLYNLESKYSGERLRFFNQKVSPGVKELLEKLIEFNPDKRMSFPELFAHPLIHLNSKQSLFENNSINNNSSEMNSKLLNSFNKSHSESNQIVFEDSKFVNYLYYKNLIIFIMDTAKKIKLCEKYSEINSIIQLIYKIELLLIKKVMNINYYMKSIMQSNQNKFNISNFEYFVQNENYKLYYNFFQDFSIFITKLYDDSKRYMSKFKLNFDINGMDNYDDSLCDNYLLEFLKGILMFYKSNSISLNKSLKNELMQGIIYCFFNYDIFTKFPFNSKFQHTKEWQDFCLYLNTKSSEEIEIRMYNYFNM